MTERQREFSRILFKLLLFLGYNVFLGFAIAHHLSNTGGELVDLGWCDGLGFVIAVTAVVYAYHVVAYAWRNLVPAKFKTVLSEAWQTVESAAANRYAQVALCVLALVAIAIFIVIDTAGNRSRAISASGIVILVILGALFSRHPR